MADSISSPRPLGPLVDPRTGLLTPPMQRWFDAAVRQINGEDGQTAINTSNIATNTARISTAEGDIAALEARLDAPQPRFATYSTTQPQATFARYS